MSEQNPPELGNVIPLHRGVERINGLVLNLGWMSLDELEVLVDHCAARLEDARADLMVAQDYLNLFAPPEGA